MKDRIRQIMESQHMTQQVFADYIGIGAATLSSIFNGRTRPTLNIVEAIKKKIPNISTDWLMFGSGEMYLLANGQESGSDIAPQPLVSTDDGTNFMSQPGQAMLDFDTPTPKSAPSPYNNINSVRNTHPEIIREEVKSIDKPQRRVIEIRVFYDDQTWETFVPAKK